MHLSTTRTAVIGFALTAYSTLLLGIADVFVNERAGAAWQTVALGAFVTAIVLISSTAACCILERVDMTTRLRQWSALVCGSLALLGLGDTSYMLTQVAPSSDLKVARTLVSVSVWLLTIALTTLVGLMANPGRIARRVATTAGRRWAPTGHHSVLPSRTRADAAYVPRQRTPETARS